MVNYDKNIRPVRNVSTQLTASVVFSLARVESMVRALKYSLTYSVKNFEFLR